MKEIDIFPWDDNFCTGIDSIDEQHRRLVAIINSLATQFAFSPMSVDLSSVFDELLQYTHYHFDEEEGIWKKYLSNENIEVLHSDNHKHFVENLKALIEAQKGKPIEEVAENTLDFLVHWLVEHILESDRAMAYTVLAIQEGNNTEKAKAIAVEKMGGFTRKMIDIVMGIYKVLSQNTLQLMRELSIHSKMEDALKEKENFLRTIVDEMPDALALKNENGEFVFANKKMAQFYNTTSEGILGKSYVDLGVPLEESEAILKNSLAVMQKGEGEVVYENRRDISSGKTRFFKSIKKPIVDSEGNRSLLVIAHDVTEENLVREELQHQKGFLEALVQTIPDLIWLKDPDGRYLACNHRFELFFGAKESEIVGKSDYDFVDKELADMFRENDLKAMKNGCPTVNEEWITYGSDGHRELLKTTKTPMWDEHGGLIGVLGIAHDITEQRRNEERLLFALSGSSDGLWDWNMQTDEVYYSPRWLEMLGYEANELPFTLDTWGRLVHEDDKEETLKRVEEYINGRSDKFETEFRMRHKNGEWKYILSRAKIPTHEDGSFKQPLRLVGTHVDITQAKQQQRALDDMNKSLALRVEEEVNARIKSEQMAIQHAKMAEMGSMVEAITHQWKQPLNILSLGIDIAEEEPKNEANLAMMREQIRFMSQIVTDFRNFFKPNTVLEHFQPCESIVKVKEMFKGSFEKQNLQITVHPHEHFTVVGHEGEFMQVLINLFNNAKDELIKQQRDDGKVDCYISKDDRCGVLRIRDNAGGIPESLLSEGKLFESRISTKGKEGSGIGLMIAKIVIEQKFHGKIWAHNVDVGAEFVIEFPLGQEEN